ncbi:MAG: hypothetical protein ACXU8S_06035 [Phenylobacterium sp.]
MSEANIPKPWFRPKAIGTGWTPQTWQGWLITLVFILLVAATVQLILPDNAGLTARWFAAERRDLGVPDSGLGLTRGVLSIGLEIAVFSAVAWWTSRGSRPLD